VKKPVVNSSRNATPVAADAGEEAGDRVVIQRALGIVARLYGNGGTAATRTALAIRSVP